MQKLLFTFYILLFSGVLFAQVPVNDNCSGAISVTPSTDCISINATLSKATASPTFITNDVWFSFVATSTTHGINVNKTKDLLGAKVFKPDLQLFDVCGGVPITSLPLDNTKIGSVPNPQDHIERTFSGLTIGKTYYYRVFNVNAGNEFDIRTSVCTLNGLGDVNDLVSGAIELPVSTVCNYRLYSISKSTKSSPEKTITAVSNPAFQFSDVWFKVKVPSNGRLSTIIDNVGIDGLEALALYTSPDNGVTLTEVASDYNSGALTIDKSGLTPGTYVYLRLCSTSVNALLGSFNICVSTPPDCGSHQAAGDNCSAPTRICDLNGYCGNTSSTYTVDLPGGTVQQDAKFGGASIENNSWLSFIASATSATFTIYVNNCKAGKGGNVLGIQAGVYEGNCASIVPKSTFWSSPNMDNTVLNATNLTVGNEYFIMIDGNLGATCDYIFATNSGVQTIDAGPDQVYCNPNTNPLQLNATGIGISTLTWSSRVGAVYNSNIGTTASLAVNPGPTVDTRYIVETKGTCAGTKDSLLVTISNCLCVKPVVNSNPSSATTCPGSTISFSMTATGASTYQWKESKDGGLTYTNLTNSGIYSGVTTPTLLLTSLTSSVNGYKYKCIIKDGTGFCSDSSSAALLTINPLTTVNSSNTHVCTGSSTTIQATATPSANNTYVWTVPNGVTNPGNVNSFSASKTGDYVCNIFTPSNLLCNDDFELPAQSAGNSTVDNINFTCWKSSTNKIEIWKTGFTDPSTFQVAKAYTGNQFIEINASTAGILSQDFALNAGTKVDISFAHRGRKGIDVMKVSMGLVGGPYTTLGQYSTDKTAWVVYTTSYTAATTGTYSLRFESVSSAGGDLSYGNFIDAVSVKTGVCAVATSKITLINDPLPTATISGTTTVCKNDASPVVSFSGFSGTANYKFTYTINGGTNITVNSSGIGVTINAPTTTVGTYTYKLESVTDANNCSQNQAGSVVITVDSTSIGGSVTSDHTVCIGSTSNLLTLSGKTGIITKWQYSISPFTTWKDTAITTSTFTSGPINQATKFRAAVKSGSCPEVFSTPALVSVDPKSVAGTLNSSTSICSGATSGVLTLTGNGSTIQKWQKSISPFTTWTDISNTTTTFTSLALTDTTKYRVIVKSGLCPADTSNKIVIAVKPIQSLNLQCGISTNTTVEFTWDKIVGATSYSYSYTVDNTGIPVTGKIAATTVDTIITVGAMGKTVNFTLTPVGASCTGPETANCISTTCLTPVTNQLQDIVVCAGDIIDIPSFTSPDSPESYSWTNSNTAIGLDKKGIRDTLFTTAMVTKQEIGIIKVNAFKSPCKGPTMTFKITVNPLPNVTTKLDTSICKGSSITLQGVGASTYVWDNGITNAIQFAPTITSTYKVIGTDSKGCKNSAQVKVIVNNLPSFTVSNSGPICANDTMFTLNQSGDVLTKWSWKSDANAMFSDSLVKQPIVKKAVNNEVFTLKGIDANGCFIKASTTLKINPVPIVNVSSNTPCEKQTISLFCSSATATTYAWSHKNGFTSNQQNPLKANCLLSDSGYYYLKFTDANGCFKLDSVFVKINPLPVFTPTAISPCQTKSFSVTANYKNANTYSWSAPVVLAGTETVLVSNSADPTVHSGDYSVTVTDAKGCSDTKKVTVTVKPSPVITVSNNGPLCANDTTLSLNQAGDVLTKWSWKSDKLAEFDDSLKQQPKLKKVTNGEIFTLKGTDANGCFSIVTTSLTVNPIPVFSVAANAPCVGQTLNLTANFVGAKTYVWSHVNGFSSPIQNPSKTNTTLSDTGLYTLKLTDVNNCSDTHSIRVTINPLPVFAPSYTPPCAEKPLLIKANYNSAFKVNRYKWEGPKTLKDSIVSIENPTITQKANPSIHNGNYNLTITDVNNCFDKKTITVSINTLPPVKSSNDFGICIGDSVTLKGGGAMTYSWNNNVQDNTSFKPITTTTYIVQGTDGNKCVNTDTVTITVIPLPTLVIPEVCSGYSLKLNSNHKPALLNAWTSDNLGIATINASSGLVTAMNAGKAVITFTDSAGCKVQKELIVNASPTIISAPLSLCEKDQILLKANHVPSALNPWTSTEKHITLNSNSGQCLGNSAGTDSIYYEDNKGCKTVKLFTVFGLPKANFTSVNAICINDTLQLTNLTSPLCDSYTWNFGDGTTSNSSFHKYNKSGFFDISLTVMDSHGCKDAISKTKAIEVVPTPQVNFVFTPDSIDILNPEVRFTTNSDGKYFKWNFGDGKPTSPLKNPTHIFPDESGKYYTVTLTAFNTKEGCTNTYSQVIVAKEPIIYYIPNSFTPNGDEINNTFQPIFSSGLDPFNYSFYIYNRWGELIFESHNVKIGWDGTYGNKIVENNTYVWKIEFNEKQTEKQHVKLGHVNVVR